MVGDLGGGLGGEVGVVDAEVLVEPGDFAGDEWGGDEAALAEGGFDGAALGVFAGEGGRGVPGGVGEDVWGAGAGAGGVCAAGAGADIIFGRRCECGDGWRRGGGGRRHRVHCVGVVVGVGVDGDGDEEKKVMKDWGGR